MKEKTYRQMIVFLKSAHRIIEMNLQRKSIVVVINLCWIISALAIVIIKDGWYFFSSLRTVLILLFMGIFGLTGLNGGIDGIRDRKVYVISGYAMGDQAIITGYIFWLGSLFFCGDCIRQYNNCISLQCVVDYSQYRQNRTAASPT